MASLALISIGLPLARRNLRPLGPWVVLYVPTYLYLPLLCHNMLMEASVGQLFLLPIEKRLSHLFGARFSLQV